VNDMAPLIIPRKEHRISRKQVSPNALRTLYRLHTKGFVAHLVGGCVRDLLLGRTPKDFDIATSATPHQIKRLFRNCRLIGRRFRLAHIHFEDEILEVSTFRRAVDPSDEVKTEEVDLRHRPLRHMKDKDGMILRDNIFGTPEEDAIRRDFTINAFAYNIADCSVVDYTTGLSDLKQRLIRPIGDAGVRFAEDPVRMLRAVRFAASHDFVIESAAWENLCALASTIVRVSPARLYEEVQKTFLFGYARPSLGLLAKSGLLSALFPALDRWIGGDNRRPALLEECLGLLDQSYRDGTPPSPALLMAALFGPGLEEESLALHHEGIPLQHAVGTVCAAFMKEISETVAIPGRIGGRLGAVLELQPTLHRKPPRKPAVTATKPEFGDALMYLRFASQANEGLRTSLEWWEAFLSSGSPPATSPEPATDGPAPKKRRRRRKRGRRGHPAGTSEKGGETENSG
jgi:poly(A) polymerase